MSEKIYYFDNAATTIVDEEVIAKITFILRENYGNPSSMYSVGSFAKDELEHSRRIIAESLGVRTNEIFFTSGGTESNNFAIKGIMYANKDLGNHIITQKTEHPAIIRVCKYLETQGFSVTYLNVDSEGFVKLDELKNAINNKTILVTIMHANNEIGTIQPLDEISRIIRDAEKKIGHKIYFHTDACQSYTKVDIDSSIVDLITINAHKIHGPKGVGALVIKKGTKIDAFFQGGGQESKMRSGTENLAGISGFSKAVEIATENDYKKMSELRDEIISRITTEIPSTKLNGPIRDKRLCNNINISFSGVEGESILLRLSEKGIMVSTGSACSSNSLEPSPILTAIGLKPEVAHSSIRISISRYTTKDEVDYLIKILKEEIGLLRSMSPFWKKK